MAKTARTAADPGCPVITRRRVVAAGAALGIVALPALRGAEFEEDPVLPLYREWLDAREEWRRYAWAPGNGDWDFPESKAAEARENAAYFALRDMTPASLAGIAALTHVLWTIAGPTSAEWNEPTYSEECEQDEHKMIAAIWRAASGQQGAPSRGETPPPEGFTELGA